MLEGIEFKNPIFDTYEENNLFSPLTKNTVIYCKNYEVMKFLAEEIKNTVNKAAEYNNYYCDDEDVNAAVFKMYYRLQKIIQINDQQITLSIEPAIVYKAKEKQDIWFANTNKDGLIAVYPFTIFKGHEEIWETGLDKVYKDIVNGRYGEF